MPSVVTSDSAPEDLSEDARRARAARAYAGKSRKQIGAAIGLHETSIRRLELSTEPITRQAYRDGIARACGLPLEWFAADLTKLADLPKRAGAPLPAPGGALGRLSGEQNSSGEDQGRRQPPGEAGQQ